MYGPRTWSTAPEKFGGIRDAVDDGDWALAERLLGRTIDVVDSAGRRLGAFRGEVVG